MSDRLAIRNERIKLFSNFLNALGVALIGLAVLRPVIAPEETAAGVVWFWGFAGLALHGLALYTLGRMRHFEERK